MISSSIEIRRFSFSIRRDVDRRLQTCVRDEREAVLALELEGDRLDERIFLERVLDLLADRLDELEEVLGLELLVVDQEQVREDVVVALVQLVEIQGMAPGWGEMAPQDTPGPRSSRS